MPTVSTFPGPVFVPVGPALPGRLLLLRAVADLDAYSETAARTELLAVCGPAGTTDWVLVEFGPDVFVGLRGLDLLLRAAATARECGRRLLLIAAPRCLTRLLDVLRLHDRLPCVPSAEDAARLAGLNRHDGRVDTLNEE